MKFRAIGIKLNLLLIFSVFLYLTSVNSISIKKAGNKAKLDDFQKRDLLMRMSQSFIFSIGNPIDEKFRKCVDDKQATTTFWKAVDKKKMKGALEDIGKECYNSGFVLPAQEDELKRTLDILVDQATIKYAAVDAIISSHRGSIPFNIQALNLK